MPLIAELKRRNVIRMAGLYLVGAWLITQVAGTVLPMFDAPAWVPRTIVILLALGFIPALVFSWVFELTPDGLKRDAEVPPEASIAPQTARRMDRAIIVALVLALLVMGFERFVLRGSEPLIDATAPRSPATSPSVRGSDPLNKSIAVLAFTDLSPNKDQEYFSDGIAEEILNALSHVKDLKVAGRTSAFYYKGRNEDLRAIGKALGVANVLEGSVRKQGDRVRITAQLIRSEDGFHLWSETYDGDLKDVFALQEKIARAITDRLQVLLTVQSTLPRGSTEIIAAGIFGDAAARARALSVIDTHLALPDRGAGMVPLSLVKLGEHKRALALVAEVPASDNSDFFARLWSPAGKATRSIPEFPAFLRTMGFIELWDRYGPPDMCKKSGNGDYVCE